MRLQVDQVEFRYPEGSPVLRGVSLDWDGTGVLCLLGSNGTGKSTLLRCMIGELQPSSGRVCLDGREVGNYRPREFARKVAYLPQTHTPSFDYRVLDVVIMGRTAHMGVLASPGHTEADEALAALAYLHVEHLAERAYTSLSGGERQLILLAAALAQCPEVLVLDEPTAHLDFGKQHVFLETVMKLADEGMGVVMTTHAPDQALHIGGLTAIMRGGRIEGFGPAHDVITDASLSALYGVDIHVAQVGSRQVCIAGPWR